MIEKITFKNGYLLEIHQDENPECPREWDNLGMMICFHKRYKLGDDHLYRVDAFNSWDELRDQIEEDYDATHILPLYLMDHSGLSISTKPFGCRWDSGQIGFIFCAHQDELTSERVNACLLAEVDTYNQFLTGDIYGFLLRKPPCEKCGADGEVTDSCWGFYGSDPVENGMIEHFPDKLRDELRTIKC